jgi:hypothetical protein
MRERERERERERKPARVRVLWVEAAEESLQKKTPTCGDLRQVYAVPPRQWRRGTHTAKWDFSPMKKGAQSSHTLFFFYGACGRVRDQKRERNYPLQLTPKQAVSQAVLCLSTSLIHKTAIDPMSFFFLGVGTGVVRITVVDRRVARDARRHRQVSSRRLYSCAQHTVWCLFHRKQKTCT